jgi:hypothetical protein
MVERDYAAAALLIRLERSVQSNAASREKRPGT